MYPMGASCEVGWASEEDLPIFFLVHFSWQVCTTGLEVFHQMVLGELGELLLNRVLLYTCWTHSFSVSSEHIQRGCLRDKKKKMPGS